MTLQKKVSSLLLPELTVLVFCLALFGSKAAAQSNTYNEVSIASPTAASLAKYGDIPVSYHTGIPNINIPIYTIKEGSLSLPISISYHAGGLKVMEPASWVGAGWSLNAGGVITRTVQGAPDERGTSSIYGQTHGHFSDYGYNNYLIVPASTGSVADHPDGFKQDWQMIADGKKDGEPDLFFFNFGGYSGKFYFNDDRTPVLVPQQDIRIEYTYPGSGSSIRSFKLTTPEGTKYYFGETATTSDVDPIEKTDPFTADGGLVEGKVISSWYLNKIESADGLFSINLFYRAENYAYFTLSTFPVPYNNEADLNNYNNYEYKLIKNFVKGVRLDSITFSTGKVNFVAGAARQDLSDMTREVIDIVNTEAKTLAAIKITNFMSSCVKQFDFSYGYFEDNTTPLRGYFSSYALSTDRKRLKLNSMQERFCDNSTVLIPPHTFEYFTELVPRRLSFGQDHWGFINGVTTNTTLIPTYTLDEFTIVQGANRDAAWPAMRGGALKKIVYPTGGFTDFEFEPNYSWVSYSKKQWTKQLDMSAGFDGGSSVVSRNLTFSGNTYRFTFTNSSSGSQALFRIYNSSNVEVFGRVLEPGQSIEERFQLTAGTYKVTLQKLSAVSGFGTELKIHEWTSYAVQKNETIGGLRIKSITNNDGVTNQNSVTAYSYQDANGKTTGVLYSRPVYVQKVRNDIIRDIGFRNQPSNTLYGCGTEVEGSGYYYKSASSIRPLDNTQGNHIGYNEVKVTQTGNGYTVYRYYGSNQWDNNYDDVAVRSIMSKDCNNSIPNYPAAPLPFEFKRGELKYEGHFNEAGKVIREVEYYPVYTDNPVTTPGLIVNYHPWEQPPPGSTTANGGAGPNLGTFYNLSTAKKTEMKTVERLYGSGTDYTEVTNIQYFESAYHTQATRQTTTTSLGVLNETKMKYSADFRPGSCETITTCFPEYTSAMNTSQSQYAIALSFCSTQSCKWDEWQRFIKRNSEARQAYVSCRRTKFTNPLNTYDSCRATAKSNASAELKPILELADRNMIVPIEVTQWKGGKLLKANFNRYDYITNPAGMPYISKTQQVNVVTPTTTFTAASVSSNTIVKDSRYEDEAWLSYDKGNLVQIQKKDGVITSYIWGYKNSYPVAKVVGASYSTARSGLFQSTLDSPANDQALRDELNKIRTNAPSALVTTYTYKPLAGITSEVAPNGLVQFYEYDELGRLSLIRDLNNRVLKKFRYNYHGQAEN